MARNIMKKVGLIAPLALAGLAAAGFGGKAHADTVQASSPQTSTTQTDDQSDPNIVTNWGTPERQSNPSASQTAYVNMRTPSSQPNLIGNWNVQRSTTSGQNPQRVSQFTSPQTPGSGRIRVTIVGQPGFVGKSDSNSGSQNGGLPKSLTISEEGEGHKEADDNGQYWEPLNMKITSGGKGLLALCDNSTEDGPYGYKAVYKSQISPGSKQYKVLEFIHDNKLTPKQEDILNWTVCPTGNISSYRSSEPEISTSKIKGFYAKAMNDNNQNITAGIYTFPGHPKTQSMVVMKAGGTRGHGGNDQTNGGGHGNNTGGGSCGGGAAAAGAGAAAGGGAAVGGAGGGTNGTAGGVTGGGAGNNNGNMSGPNNVISHGGGRSDYNNNNGVNNNIVPNGSLINNNDHVSGNVEPDDSYLYPILGASIRNDDIRDNDLMANLLDTDKNSNLGLQQNANTYTSHDDSRARSAYDNLNSELDQFRDNFKFGQQLDQFRQHQKLNTMQDISGFDSAVNSLKGYNSGFEPAPKRPEIKATPSVIDQGPLASFKLDLNNLTNVQPAQGFGQPNTFGNMLDDADKNELF